MKLINKGEFDGNPESLPHAEHMPGAVVFKEMEDLRRFGVMTNSVALGIMVGCLTLFFLRGGMDAFSIWGALFVMVAALPHELLHAIWFREEVYLYKNLKNGLIFVTGTETMSKTRFILMSLCPNLVLGVIPFLIFLVFPQFGFLGTVGALATGMGAGDYYNVYNTLKQVPKGGRIYQYQLHSYWYMP